jgi:V/A-type H+-transporting ATPase subunit F
MSEIAMVGDRDSILGFKALGVSIFPAETKGEAIGILRNLIEQEFKIAFITEQVAPDAETIADEMADRTMPVIMMIPSNRGTTGVGMQRMQGLVRKAAGADILGQED